MTSFILSEKPGCTSCTRFKDTPEDDAPTFIMLQIMGVQGGAKVGLPLFMWKIME